MPVKRELSSTPSIDDEYLQTPSSSKKSPKAKKVKGEPKEKRAKTAWSQEEDDILISIMEQMIKENMWERIKADGRLVERTGYGCQYHAKASILSCKRLENGKVMGGRDPL
ncbi:hypothetical protein P7C73_g1809, partial [Tremellales sp. Uapishka_1]